MSNGSDSNAAEDAVGDAGEDATGATDSGATATERSGEERRKNMTQAQERIDRSPSLAPGIS